MKLLQTQQATGILTETAQAGLAFGILVVMVLILGWVVYKLWKEGKEKSKVHGEQMTALQDKIEKITEERRHDAISSINFVRDLQGDMKELIATINKLL